MQFKGGTMPDTTSAPAHPSESVPISGPSSIGLQGEVRYFGGIPGTRLYLSLGAAQVQATIVRFVGDRDVQMELTYGAAGLRGQVRVMATPSEFRALAAALLSCAHDAEA